VLAALTRPMIPPRGEEMRRVLSRVHRRLQPLFGTQRPVYVATAAATAMMEAAIRCAAKKRVLSLVNGGFGERFAAVAERCGRQVTRLIAPPGATWMLEEVGVALEHGEYDAVTAVHVETSTGVMNDMETLARLVRAQRDTLLLVDSVASVGGAPVDADRWGADVLLAASQKALALPPGLAFACCSERALDRARTMSDRGFYLDLLRCDEYWHRGETAPAPAISLIFALDAQLDLIERETLPSRFERHALMAALVHEWCDRLEGAGALPLSILAPPPLRAPTVTCFTWKGEPGAVVDAMGAQGFTIGSGYRELAATTFRIGHLGEHTVAGLGRLLDALARVLERAVHASV